MNVRIDAARDHHLAGRVHGPRRLGQRARRANGGDLARRDTDIRGNGSARQHASAVRDDQVQHHSSPCVNVQRGIAGREMRQDDAGAMLRTMNTSRLAGSPAGQRVEPAWRIHRVLHGMDRRRSARTVGKLNDAFDPQQVFAVLSRQTAKRDRELQPRHRLTQHDDERRDAVGVHRGRRKPLPPRQDRRMVAAEQHRGRIGAVGIHQPRRRI